MAENTRTVQDDSAALPPGAWIVAAILAALAYFLGLNLPLVGPDEPRYAQIAREMYERGDWITPTLGGTPWFEKPALLYWLEIAAYHLFGVSEFAARFGSALFGVGTVTALWILGRHVLPNTSFANWLGLMAASTLGILAFSHGASFDILITFTLTGALVSFFLAVEGEDNPRYALVLFYVFMGLALLAKGLIGAVFPVATAVLYFAATWRLPRRLIVLSVFWGIPIAMLIAAIWYGPMYVRHGSKFIDEFIIQHHFQRFFSNKYQHPQPFYFFFWILPLMTLPWLPAWIGSIWRLVFPRKLEDAGSEMPDATPKAEWSTFRSLSLFAVVWIAVPLVFFSFSGSKLPGYILPAVPGTVIMSAIFAYRLIEQRRGWHWPLYAVGCLVLAVCSVLLVFVVPGYAAGESVRDLMLAAARRGYGDQRVYSLHTISHNAEFYAAGRLLRDAEGQQKRLYGPAEVVTEMERAGVTEALVLVPGDHLDQIVAYPPVRSDVVADNGELFLVHVERTVR